MSNRNAQQVVLDLLKIFHSTCEEQNIPYILWKTSARSAMLRGTLPSGYLKVEVCVKCTDCERLANALNAVDSQKYFCEYWGNNDVLPYMCMRFHDRSTTYMEFNETHAFAGAGLRIEVIPLRSLVYSDGVENKRVRTAEFERCAALLPYSTFANCDAIPVGSMKKAKAQKPAAEFFAPYAKDDGAGKFHMWHPAKKCLNFDRDFFENRQQIDFGGVASYVPAAFEDYMVAVGDKYWRDKALKSVPDEKYTWFSADMPYELALRQFEKAEFPLEGYYENRERFQADKVESQVLLTRLGRMRKEVRFTHDEITVEEHYTAEKQREIMDAFVAGDWEKLREEFALYRALMVKNGDTFLEDHPFAMPKPLQVAFIVLAEHDGDHQIALRAWMCFEDAYGKNEAKRLEGFSRLGIKKAEVS